jgi:hypothetical protein
MKKLFLILLSVILILALSQSSMVSLAAKGDVIVDFVNGLYSELTTDYGFFGPFFEGKMVAPSATDGLVFDLSVEDSWFATEVSPQDMAPVKYAVLDIKTDDPSGVTGSKLCFGGVRKFWSEWANHDGKGLPALTTSYQKVCVDLTASGVDSVIADGVDFGMNQGNATGGHIYIKTVTFTDDVPNDAVAGSGTPAPVSPKPTPSPSPSPAPTPAPVTDGSSVKADFAKGANKDSRYGEYGFFGPYSDRNMVVMSETEGLIFNLSAIDSWVTAEMAPQEMKSYQYATLVIRTDDPTASKGFTMTIGGVAKKWEDWTNYDGKGAPALTTDYQIISLDLFKSGVNDPSHNITGDGDNGPDFALTKGEATGGYIYINSITFQDYPPENAVGDGNANPNPFPVTEPTTKFHPEIPYDNVVEDKDGNVSYYDDEGNHIIMHPDGAITYELITGEILYITKNGEGSYRVDKDGKKEYLPLEGNGDDEPAVDGNEPTTALAGGNSNNSAGDKSNNSAGKIKETGGKKSTVVPNPATDAGEITIALVTAITTCGVILLTSKKK